MSPGGRYLLGYGILLCILCILGPESPVGHGCRGRDASGGLRVGRGGERMRLCYAKTRAQVLTWHFAPLGRSAIFADQAADDVSALDPAGDIDSVARLV